MRTDELDYDLPEHLIAQQPLSKRDDSRLLCLDRPSGAVDHHRFFELPELLHRPSLLVVNDTRVFPARLLGQRSTGGAVELLLIEALERGESWERWRCLGRPRRKLGPGAKARFGEIVAEVIGEEPSSVIVELRCEGEPVRAARERVGRIPLPPYIRRSADEVDRDRYQTVYAGLEGESVAAPTAGLHFTPPVLEALRAAGHEVVKVTLQVGPGTFRPVRAERLEEHQMEAERYEVSAEAAEAINRARREGRAVIAVGTTVVRTLESIADEEGRLEERRGATSLFITPGYRFRVISGLLTNFHLPRSTLLALVGAFVGLEPLLAAYREAVRREYRFYSYGDAMLIR